MLPVMNEVSVVVSFTVQALSYAVRCWLNVSAVISVLAFHSINMLSITTSLMVLHAFRDETFQRIRLTIHTDEMFRNG